MTVKELIEALAKMPQDAKVIVLQHVHGSEEAYDADAAEIVLLPAGVGIFARDDDFI